MSRSTVLLLSAAFALPGVVCPLAAQTQSRPLTVEAIYARQPVAGEPPNQLTWSPDGKHLTYLNDGELIDLDPGTAKPHVLVSRVKMASLNEKGGSEQDRDHRRRYNMASYIWSPDSTHLLFDSDGSLWLYDLHAGAGIKVGSSGTASGDNPKFSPDGAAVSFVSDRGLAVIHLHDAGAPTTMLAPAASPAILNGGVDWVYEEELNVRSNYFWSPDSQNLAYLQMDETHVPEYPLTDWIPTHATVHQQRYPQPGDPNPSVRVGVVSARGGATQWMQVPLAAGQDYIPRFGWADAQTLWIEVLTRDHKHRIVYLADIASGAVHKTLEISDDKFLDATYDMAFSDGLIVLEDWSSGHTHLALYSYDPRRPAEPAKLVRQLTRGDFEVNDIYRVDFQARQIDYASNEGDPREQQLWQVSFDGERKPLSAGAGWHEGNFAPTGSAFVDRQSSRLDPATLRLCTAPGACNVFWQTDALKPYNLHAPLMLALKAKDGTTLYGTLMLPEGKTAPASVPLILNPYGGPGEQMVANRWNMGLLFDTLLAQHGFAVLRVDNRGMGGRGRAFAQAAYHNFGPVQLEDQLTVLDDVLAKYPQLDPKRLGWWGWSWGGSFTLYAMSHSDRFRAGVAVAPVTDWRNYDSVYTERYMGLPAADAAYYREDAAVNAAAHLHGRLLLVHGTGDDNVHIENTVQFVQQLIEAQLPYDLQIYPRKTHSIAGSDVRTHLYNRILAQFEQYLMPPVK